MSVAPLALPDEIDGLLNCSFWYEKYRLDYDRMVGGEKKEFWEEQMEYYYLLLPYVRQNSTFARQFAVVHHDWDVVGVIWGKVLPSLCKALLAQDVLV